MASYYCKTCGASRSETPFCHGPMACEESGMLQAAILCLRKLDLLCWGWSEEHDDYGYFVNSLEYGKRNYEFVGPDIRDALKKIAEKQLSS